MTEPLAPREPAALDDAGTIARFAAAPDDAAGLIAYALHRRALVEFRGDFSRLHGREPDAAAENAFLIGETAQGRIAAYRANAEALLAAGGAKAASSSALAPGTVKPRPARPRWPWMGLWINAPLAPPQGPLNWRGLFWRLFVLLLAVVVTALLLRVLIVRP